MSKGRLEAFSDVAIGGSFLSPLVAWALYIVVALMWLDPGRRIEKSLAP
jgi:hypothetical protein